MMTGDFIHVYSNGAGIGDTARLGAQVVSGIGFLGVGTIIVTDRDMYPVLRQRPVFDFCVYRTCCGIGFTVVRIFTTLGLILVFKYENIEVYGKSISNT